MDFEDVPTRLLCIHSHVRACAVSMGQEDQVFSLHNKFITHWLNDIDGDCLKLYIDQECSGSVVECLTGDRGATGLSLTGVTVLCP